ncbi:MAG: hypothetical protein QMD12_01465 [Candidatus Aenigmarchaeota archaeon]|nr:hypothetical protein [Candidatus Aenigmarchaeota archaeon]
MARNKTDVVTIKKYHLFYVIISIVFFLIGFFSSSLLKMLGADQKAIDNCKKFCEFIPDTEFAYIDANSHCYCTQKNQRIFDTKLNKTLIMTKTVDAGIITDVEIKNYIEQAR